MKPNGYSRIQIILHWLVFALVAAQFLLGETIAEAMEKIREGAQVPFNPLIAQHVFGGGLILLLVIWRLALRKKRGVPDMPEGESPAQKMVAKGTHHILYLLLILMPISGSVAWFLGVNAASNGHQIMKVVLIVLVGLHVVAALYHQFVLKNNLLDRMKTPRD